MFALMSNMLTWAGSLRRDERGATAVEYGLMVALIAVAIIVVVGLLGEGLRDTFQTVVDRLPGGGGG